MIANQVGREEAQEAQETSFSPARVLFLARKNEFANLQSRGPEVDQETVLPAGRPEVTKKLGGVFGGKGSNGLDFDDQFSLHDHIREVVAQDGFIRIANLERILNEDLQPLLSQSEGQPGLVNLLEVAVSQVPMQIQSGRPDLVAQGKN